MKRVIASCFLVVAFIFLVTSANAAELWGSKNSNKYHYPTCRWAQKIYPNNLVKFNSPEEATKAGYVPCKVCKPPLASRSETTDEQITIAMCKGNEPQRRGCCSWHGGVCGCENGRAVCCDNTLSPSCGCD